MAIQFYPAALQALLSRSLLWYFSVRMISNALDGLLQKAATYKELYRQPQGIDIQEIKQLNTQ